jgi:hypothetical protein
MMKEIELTSRTKKFHASSQKDTFFQKNLRYIKHGMNLVLSKKNHHSEGVDDKDTKTVAEIQVAPIIAITSPKNGTPIAMPICAAIKSVLSHTVSHHQLKCCCKS